MFDSDEWAESRNSASGKRYATLCRSLSPSYSFGVCLQSAVKLKGGQFNFLMRVIFVIDETSR